MSPPPFSTATLKSQGGARRAAAALVFEPERPAAKARAAARAASRNAETPIAIQRPSGLAGGGPAGSPERRFASRSSTPRAVEYRSSARTAASLLGKR